VRCRLRRVPSASTFSRTQAANVPPFRGVRTPACSPCLVVPCSRLYSPWRGWSRPLGIVERNSFRLRRRGERNEFRSTTAPSFGGIPIRLVCACTTIYHLLRYYRVIVPSTLGFEASADSDGSRHFSLTRTPAGTPRCLLRGFSPCSPIQLLPCRANSVSRSCVFRFE
jgi:hypothetical protein